MRDIAGYQKGAENIEVIERQCCTHCRCTLSQSIYWNTGRSAEHLALTGGREKNKYTFRANPLQMRRKQVCKNGEGRGDDTKMKWKKEIKAIYSVLRQHSGAVCDRLQATHLLRQVHPEQIARDRIQAGFERLQWPARGVSVTPSCRLNLPPLPWQCPGLQRPPAQRLLL